MLTCSEFLDRYSDFDDSLLPAAEESRFRAHLAACGSCARYDRVLRKGRMLARQVEARPSPDFVPRLQQRILSGPDPRLVGARPVAAGGFVTLALAALAAGWLVDGAPASASPVLEGVRTTSLPLAAHVGPADWTVARVDPRSVSSYSPVVIGPPAYRATRSVTTDLMSAPGHTLD